MGDLKKGMECEEVVELAKKLNKAGAKPKLKGTGYFGPATEKAVKFMQKKLSMKETGIADKAFMAKLAGGGKPAKKVEWPYRDPAAVLKDDGEIHSGYQTVQAKFLERLKTVNGAEATKLKDQYKKNAEAAKSAFNTYKAGLTKLDELHKKFKASKDPTEQAKIVTQAKPVDAKATRLANAWSAEVMKVAEVEDKLLALTEKVDAMKWTLTDPTSHIKRNDKYRGQQRKDFLHNSKICATEKGKFFEKMREELFELNNEAERVYALSDAQLKKQIELKKKFDAAKAGNDAATAQKCLNDGLAAENTYNKQVTEWQRIIEKRREFRQLLKAQLDDQKVQ